MFFKKINLIIFFLTTQSFALNITSDSAAFLNSLNGSTKEAYEYAIKNPDILDNFLVIVDVKRLNILVIKAVS